MKNLLLTLSLIWLPFLSQAQTVSTPDLEAYFSAIIVSDLDTSIAWYSNKLGFQVINKVESNERGFKQANLGRGRILIELIELDKAVKLKDVVVNYNSKTRTIGFFKIGFLVSDFGDWIVHLTDEKVDFYGDIVSDDTTGKRMIIIIDPDGNRVQIFDK